jgi:hypothetical protein
VAVISAVVPFWYNLFIHKKLIQIFDLKGRVMLRRFFSWLRKPLPNVVYMEMRGQMFRLDPNKVGIKRSNDKPNVWGVMTEFSTDSGYVTIVSLANGRTNMYFSSGSVILGAGDK